MKERFKVLMLSLSILFLCVKSQCQSQPDSNLVEKYLLDFSVPDMPAFKALGTDPSNILRPSDAKKFAVMISPFYSNGKGVIPKNFALEVAPWKLASKDWTLSDFTNSGWKRFLYRSSFSLGAVNDTTDFPSKLGIGYRVSFLSKRADIYRAAQIRNEIFSASFGQEAVMAALQPLQDFWVNVIVKPTPPDVQLKIKYIADHKGEFMDFFATIKEYLKANPNPILENQYETFLNIYTQNDPNHVFTKDELEDLIEGFGKRIDKFIENYKKENWNASRTDIAIALVGQSKDSLISKAEFSSFSVWVTQALRIHRGAQLLIGGNLSFPRSVNKYSSKIDLSLNLRYYLGTQDFRGFLETQYAYQKKQIYGKSLLFNLGAELRIGNNFWIVASSGIDNYIKTNKPLSKLVSSIDLRYGYNKKK